VFNMPDTVQFEKLNEGAPLGVPAPPPRWRWVLLGTLAVSLGLALLPHRTEIPPNIESDYCYLLLAADRFHDGKGLTSLAPQAPHQPWEWRYDWGWLTQWPIGYPLLVAGVRRMLGGTTINACLWINLVACALALVGWFAWVRYCAPRGVGGWLLAGVAAGCAVSTASLINPTTDILLVALIPLVLFCAVRALRYAASGQGSLSPCEPRASARADAPSAKVSARDTLIPPQNVRLRSLVWFAVTGLAAGGLFWVRYAAMFVPLALGIYFTYAWARQRVRWGCVAVYTAAGLLPVVALLGLHRLHSADASAQAQLNLGSTAALDFSPTLLQEAWWTFTGMHFYDYLWYSHWLFALWPGVLVLGVCCVRPARRAFLRFLATPGVGLSALLLICLFGMLVGTTAVFGDKYHYTTLERYYFPGRPLYFLLFAAPLLLIPRRTVGVLACAGLLVAAYWTVGYEWSRPYQRWLAANRPVTPYGRWAIALSPGSGELFDWLKRQAEPGLVVTSNWHDHIALETGLATIPLPPDATALQRWLERIRTARGVDSVSVLFVLDPDNGYRQYYLPEPTEVVQRFDLSRKASVPAAVAAWVFEYQEDTDLAGR